jgi:hypothetical protein
MLVGLVVVSYYFEIGSSGVRDWRASSIVFAFRGFLRSSAGIPPGFLPPVALIRVPANLRGILSASASLSRCPRASLSSLSSLRATSTGTQYLPLITPFMNLMANASVSGVGRVFILENLPCDEPTGYGGYAPLIAAEMVLEWDFFFLLCGGDCSSVNLPAG